MTRLFAVVAVALSTAACHFSSDAKERDAGPTVDRNYQVGAFSKIEVAGPYDVKVTAGGQPGVSAKGGSALLDETDVVVDGDTLRIMPKKHKGFRFSWHNGTAQFAVSTAALSAASIAGSGSIDVDRVVGDFDGDVAGSGDLRLASLNGGRLKANIAGSGGVSAAAGTLDAVDVNIAGSGDVDVAGAAAKTADVSIAGSGSVKAHATDTAKVSIMGSGDVDIVGGAKCSVSKAGSGDVTCH